ncbi:MAG: hypothetical protein HKL81_01815 [Acidimicrobiaceae bacterium]|nr:hypothetical protein [Acidimicrobiaceae bacterium]
MALKRSRKVPSGTALSLSILLLVVAVIVLTLVIVTTNPSSKAQKTTATIAAKKSTTQSSKGTTSTSVTSTSSSANTNLSVITFLSPSSSVAKSLTTFVENLSATESSAATLSKITYHGYILSPAVLEGRIPLALAAFSYDPNSLNVKVMAYQQGAWAIVAQLARPSDLPAAVDPSFPWMVTGSYSPGVTVGHVTDNQTPTFMIPLDFADNIPGAFVIQTFASSISSWQYADFYPSGSSAPTNVLARTPTFVGAEIKSLYDNCNPDCASGNVTPQYWKFDATKLVFTQLNQ